MIIVYSTLQHADDVCQCGEMEHLKTGGNPKDWFSLLVCHLWNLDPGGRSPLPIEVQGDHSLPSDPNLCKHKRRRKLKVQFAAEVVKYEPKPELNTDTSRDSSCQTYFPTEAALRSKARKKEGKVAKRKAIEVEDHYDDLGDDLSGLPIDVSKEAADVLFAA